jgi:twinkle protein
MDEKKFRQEKNAEPVLFGRDFCKGEEITLVEGEIDCLTMSQYGINVASIPSGASDLRWLDHEWDFLNQFKKIYLCLDGDEAGQKNIEEIVNRIGRWRCYNVILPFKDANDCLMNDVSDEKIKECIDAAKGFDPNTLLKASDFEDEINDMFAHPEKMHGIALPWEKLNDILLGWREGELTIWSGRSGSGKSTILNEVIYSLLRKGHKVIIASLEMLPKKYLKWMLVRIKQRSVLDPDSVKEALNELENLYIVNLSGQINPTELLDVMDFSARKYGVKHFFIDSLMKVNIQGADKNEEQKNFCNLLISNLSKKYDGHTHLVAHPRKSWKDTDRPDKMDVAGSGDITNLADNVISLYRMSKEEKTNIEDSGLIAADTVVSVLKNREWGNEDKVEFKYNPDTKTFTEC